MPPNRRAPQNSSKRPNLSATFAQLSPKRQELFRPVLENAREYVLLNVRELARKLKVDPATALRVALKMGFGSFREFQHYLHELSVSRATSLDTMGASKTTGSDLSAHVREAVEGLRQARANGAYCIGVADTLVSPMARFSNECFIASVETPSFGASYAAPMCLLNGILAACGHYNRGGSMELLRKAAEEQRTGFRWFQE